MDTNDFYNFPVERSKFWWMKIFLETKYNGLQVSVEQKLWASAGEFCQNTLGLWYEMTPTNFQTREDVSYFEFD